MPKITISAILTIIRVILTLGEKVIRAIYTIIDICDDGIINGSVEKPDWYNSLIRIISTIESSFVELGSISDKISEGSSV